MKSLGVLIITIIFLLTIIPISVISTDPSVDQVLWTVNNNGAADFTRIQEAINAASDGDTIFVNSGFYDENIHIDKKINLIGEDRNTTIIDGKNYLDTIVISSDQVNVTGFCIQNSGSSGRDAAIQIESNQVIIIDNIIRNSTIGIFLHNAHENSISQNQILLCKDYGIHLNNAHQNVILHNDIGFNRWGSFITLAFGNTIQSNVIHDNFVHGI